MNEDKKALFPGRFQPPSIAHAHTLDVIRRKWRHVVILITYASNGTPNKYREKWREFLHMSDLNFLPEKNPFTPEEVQEMWQSHIDANGLQESVSCKINVRPHLDPHFNTNFPPSAFVIVYPKAGCTETAHDLLREQVISKILNRNIVIVHPGFMLHNMEIKLRVAAGESWERFIAPGAYETFIRLRGPERIIALSGR